jgi:hypothetical protein
MCRLDLMRWKKDGSDLGVLLRMFPPFLTNYVFRRLFVSQSSALAITKQVRTPHVKNAVPTSQRYKKRTFNSM